MQAIQGSGGPRRAGGWVEFTAFLSAGGQAVQGVSPLGFLGAGGKVSA